MGQLEPLAGSRNTMDCDKIGSGDGVTQTKALVELCQEALIILILIVLHI